MTETTSESHAQSHHPAPVSNVKQQISLPPLRPITIIYLTSLVAASASLVISFLARSDSLTGNQFGLAVALTLGVTIAYSTPLNAGHRVFHTLETVAVLPAILLLPPGVAMLVGWVGMTFAHWIRPRAIWLPPNLRRTSWSETIFNGSSLALQAAAASLVLIGTGWDFERPDFALPAPVIAIVLSGLAIYLVQRVTLAGVVSFEEVLPLPTVFYDMTIGKQPAEHLQFLAQLGIGLLATVVANAQPWALSLLVLPMAAVYVALQRHIAMRRRAEANLAAAQRVASLGSLDWDIRTGDQQWSPALYALLGLDPDTTKATQSSYLSAVHPDDQPLVAASLESAVHGVSYAIDHRIVLPGGTERIIHSRGEIVPHRDGRPERVVGTLHDITERKRLEQKLAHQAYHDALTDLPNRALFTRRLDEALRLDATQTPRIAVLFLDLDRFKLINDTLGHEAGDQLLIAVAERLRGIVRTPRDVVARLGGDEFTVLLDDVRDDAEAEAVALRIIAAMKAPISLLETRDIVVSTSVGIVRPGAGHQTGTEVLRDADNALYRAKEGGRNRYALFDESMRAESATRVALEADLRYAIERDEFHMLYQPKIELATGKIVAVEAFLRWAHPTRGEIAPSQFIPIAEEIGLMGAIGAWSLETACREAASWRSTVATPPILNVNISSKQFHDPALVDDIATLLADTGLESNRLQLEIAEIAAMKNTDATIAILWRLKMIGVRAVIDDYGTGSSSLGTLPRFPVETLQLDHSFVAGLGKNENATKVAEAVFGLAHGLGLRVVAEGVERLDQLTQLVSLGCDQAQGNLFAPPLTAGDLLIFLNEPIRRLHPEPVVAARFAPDALSDWRPAHGVIGPIPDLGERPPVW